jgi:hypothetical protein
VYRSARTATYRTTRETANDAAVDIAVTASQLISTLRNGAVRLFLNAFAAKEALRVGFMAMAKV